MNTLKAVSSIVLASVVLASACSTEGQWYENTATGVYACATGDDIGICHSVVEPTDMYETIYDVPDMVGGEYYEFKASGMRSCVVLRKGNVYDPETLCGVSIVDTIEFLQDGTL